MVDLAHNWSCKWRQRNIKFTIGSRIGEKMLLVRKRWQIGCDVTCDAYQEVERLSIVTVMRSVSDQSQSVFGRSLSFNFNPDCFRK